MPAAQGQQIVIGTPIASAAHHKEPYLIRFCIVHANCATSSSASSMMDAPCQWAPPPPRPTHIFVSPALQNKALQL